eukprot:1809421-Amphidinium_carterae.1
MDSSSCLIAALTLNADAHVLLSSPFDEVIELAVSSAACLGHQVITSPSVVASLICAVVGF